MEDEKNKILKILALFGCTHFHCVAANRHSVFFFSCSSAAAKHKKHRQIAKVASRSIVIAKERKKKQEQPFEYVGHLKNVGIE